MLKHQCSHVLTNGLVGVARLLLSNLNRFTSPPAGCRICHELRMAALLHAHEPEDGFFNGTADGEQAVVD